MAAADVGEDGDDGDDGAREPEESPKMLADEVQAERRAARAKWRGWEREDGPEKGERK